jgi:hypothetical protein
VPPRGTHGTRTLLVACEAHTDAARGAHALLVARGARPVDAHADDAPPIELLVETIVNRYGRHLLDEMWASSPSLRSYKEKEQCH